VPPYTPAAEPLIPGRVHETLCAVGSAPPEVNVAMRGTIVLDVVLLVEDVREFVDRFIL
jgi:hypothetical protein